MGMICKTVNNRGQILRYLRHLLLGFLAIRDNVWNYKELNSGARLHWRANHRRSKAESCGQGPQKGEGQCDKVEGATVPCRLPGARQVV